MVIESKGSSVCLCGGSCRDNENVFGNIPELIMGISKPAKCMLTGLHFIRFVEYDFSAICNPVWQDTNGFIRGTRVI